MLLLRLWPALCLFSSHSGASKCYTCSGGCYKAEGCNCEFGFCEGDFCFSERRPQFQDKHLKYEVVKGCAKNPDQPLGCSFVRDRNSLSCICRGEFCNAALEPPELRPPSNRCYQCANHEDCATTCDGHYCAKDLYTGLETCGFGQPYLPFSRRNSERLFEGERWGSRRSCVTTQMGIHKHAECVCRGDLCNRNFLAGPLSALELSQVSLSASSGEVPQLYTCFSCSRHSEDNVLPPECQEDTCQGQFCILSLETRTKEKPVGVIRNAGCLNSSHVGQVQIGCSQKWRGAEHEIIHCACRGDFCNINLHTAFASGAGALWPPLLLALAAVCVQGLS